MTTEEVLSVLENHCNDRYCIVYDTERHVIEIHPYQKETETISPCSVCDIIYDRVAHNFPTGALQLVLSQYNLQHEFFDDDDSEYVSDPLSIIRHRTRETVLLRAEYAPEWKPIRVTLRNS